jgi:chromosome segregation ATPase
MSTLAELETRLEALENEVRGEKGLPDQRRALTTVVRLLEDTRERMSMVERHLSQLREGLLELTAEQARTRGSLEAKIDVTNVRIDAVRNEMKTDIAGLRRDMPSIVAEAMREVLRDRKG